MAMPDPINADSLHMNSVTMHASVEQDCKPVLLAAAAQNDLASKKTPQHLV
jgi:hypothetical protein